MIAWGNYIGWNNKGTGNPGKALALLEEYPGAAAAYSLRDISGSNDNVVRVRRSSDDNEQDFKSSEVSGGALTTFVGAGNDGFVTTWYDQVPVEELSSAYGTSISGTVFGSTDQYADVAPISVGNFYRIQWTVSAIQTRGRVRFRNAANGSNITVLAGQGQLAYFTENGVYTSYVASDAGVSLWFLADSGQGFTYSNVSVVEIDRIPNDAAQSSASAQPKIVDSGSLITKGSFPAITFDVGDRLEGTDITPSYHYSFFGGFFDNLVNQCNLYQVGDGTNRVCVGLLTSSGKMGLKTFGTNNDVEKVNSIDRISNDTKHLVTARFENVASGDANIYVDSVDDSSGSGGVFTGTKFKIGSATGRPVCSSFYELVVYNTDQSSNQSGIEDNINLYYRIYAPLLDDFGGAFAAYSLRNLSSNTTNVVRVRRSSDDAEQDFTADEVIDGTLTTFVGGSNDGFVTTWYDQSGNSNDSTQASASAQPKVVANGGLILENNKPSIDFDGTAQYMDLNNLDSSENVSVFTALKPDTNNDDSQFYNMIETGDKAISLGQGGIGTSAVFGSRYYNINTASNIDTDGAAMLASLNIVLLSNFFTSSSSADLFLNGTAGATTDSARLSTSGSALGGNNFGSNLFDGKMQEMVVYLSDKSADRTGIEGNINRHYNIYT